MRSSIRTGLAHLVAGGARFRRRCYDAGWLKRQRLAAPVISVGALAMGGSGKTPVARWLSRHIRREYGLEVGLVSRGYRGRMGGVAHLVSPTDQGLIVGDEAAMHASSGAAAAVVRGADKASAARLALARGAQVIVLDDAFQHLALARDLDIVLMGADDRDQQPFPRGRAREGEEALERAQLLWQHGRDGSAPSPALDQRRRPLVLSRNRARVLRQARAGREVAPSWLAGREVFAVAAIAQPGAFVELLQRLGAKVVGTRFLPDHARIGDETLLRCRALAGGARLVCTEKDLFHLGAPAPEDLWSLECDVELVAGEEWLAAALSAALGRSRC